MAYEYRGKRLKIAPYAEIQHPLSHNGKFREQVQAILDKTEPWEKGENPIETVRFGLPIAPMAVPVENSVIAWGVNRVHKARKPGVSPFVDKEVDPSLLGYITVELEGSGEKPLLTRLYGGEYTPPLPWMSSARDADGGKAACIAYWQTHAFLNRSPNFLLPATRTTEPPAWFSGS